jgi:hypothetical protein
MYVRSIVQDAREQSLLSGDPRLFCKKAKSSDVNILIHTSHVRVHSSYILYVDTVRQRVLNEL